MGAALHDGRAFVWDVVRRLVTAASVPQEARRLPSSPMEMIPTVGWPCRRNTAPELSSPPTVLVLPRALHPWLNPAHCPRWCTTSNWASSAAARSFSLSSVNCLFIEVREESADMTMDAQRRTGQMNRLIHWILPGSSNSPTAGAHPSWIFAGGGEDLRRDVSFCPGIDTDAPRK